MSLEESNAAAATADGLAADLEAERAAQRAQVAAFQDVLARVMELREEIQNNAPTGEAQKLLLLGKKEVRRDKNNRASSSLLSMFS